MASASELIRRLRRAGFILVKNGGNHDIYEQTSTGKKVIVARHKGEMPNGTYRAILKDAGLK